MAVIKGTSNIPTSSSGGGSSNAKQYNHIITYKSIGRSFFTTIITNDDSTKMTVNDFRTYINSLGLTWGSNKLYYANGTVYDSNAEHNILGLAQGSSSNSIRVAYISVFSTGQTSALDEYSCSTFEDVVKEA